MTATTTFTKKLKDSLTLLAVLILIGLLTGCVGNHTRKGMTTAMTKGSFERTEKLSAQEIRKILSDHFGTVNVRFTDYEYTLPANEKVAELSKFTDDISTSDWDCDDYAIAAMVSLRNYAFGAMYVKTESGKRHAMNVFVNQYKEVVYWEPQSGDYYQGRFHKPDLIFF